MHGIAHPLVGIDHILAMVAVGVFAANLGGRALWAAPLSFMGCMLLGGALGFFGLPLPLVEVGIALSLVVLGIAVAMKWDLPVVAAMAAGRTLRDLPRPCARHRDAARRFGRDLRGGFVTATGLLHLIGIGLGLGVGGLRHSRRIAQFGGACSRCRRRRAARRDHLIHADNM